MPTKLIVDCSTGVTTEVELTPEEINEIESNIAARAAAEAAKEEELLAKSAAKQSAQEKLKALGLTDTEILAITGI